jgi:hypothetical protein
MRLTIYLISLIILTANLWAQETETGQQKTLDDIVVKETFQVGSEEEKLPVILKADFSNLVEVEERIHWSSVAWHFEGMKPGFETFSSKLSAPELTSIIPQPAKVFTANFEELARWQIDIFTSDGQKFRSLNGEGNPPKSIAWDGLSDDDMPLIPGESYAYSFTAVDRAGNKRTFPGSAFSVPAFYMKHAEAIWVGLSYSTIFSPNGFGLTHDADEIADEIVNFIYYFANEGNINISSDHQLTDQFLTLVAKKLGQDVSLFQKQQDSGYQSKCLVVRIK